jgi:hypothetical protein
MQRFYNGNIFLDWKSREQGNEHQNGELNPDGRGSWLNRHQDKLQKDHFLLSKAPVQVEAPMMQLLSSLDWTTTISTLLRPVLILVCGMMLFNLPTLIYKLGMFIRGIVYLLLCNDKSWKKPQDPNIVFGPLLKSPEKVERKTVYFVRHGESTWNDTFNKGSHRSAVVFAVGFIPGLIKALLYELYLILSGKLDRFVAHRSIF